jgi:hypothetical protein
METQKTKNQILFLATERGLLLAYYAVAFLTLFDKIELSKILFIFTPVPYIAIAIYNTWKNEDRTYTSILTTFVLHGVILYMMFKR